MAKITYQKVVIFEEGDTVSLVLGNETVNATVNRVNNYSGSVGLVFSDGSITSINGAHLTLVESWDGRVPDDIDSHKQAIDQAYANGYREAVDLYAGDIY